MSSGTDERTVELLAELQAHRNDIALLCREIRQLGGDAPDIFDLEAAGELVRIELSAKVRTDAVVRGETANVLERAAAELRAEGRRVVAEDAAE